MKKHIPNILTFSRVILFTPLLIWLTLDQQWILAAVSFGFGLATNCFDGYLARRWDACSKLGADILQPVCDLVYAATAVVLLIVTGRWSFWVGVLLLAIAGVLQLISFLAGKLPDNQTIQLLKRHQNYLHPLYSCIVQGVAWFAYLLVADAALESIALGGLVILFFMNVLLVSALNYDHIRDMVKRSSVRA